jgi:hypothetical protein
VSTPRRNGMGSREAEESEGTAACEIMFFLFGFCHSGQWRQGGGEQKLDFRFSGLMG